MIAVSEEEFVALARAKYHDLQQLDTQPTFYQYEQSFELIWQDLGRQVLQASLSKIPNDRRKKKRC